MPLVLDPTYRLNRIAELASGAPDALRVSSTSARMVGLPVGPCLTATTFTALGTHSNALQRVWVEQDRMKGVLDQ